MKKRRLRKWVKILLTGASLLISLLIYLNTRTCSNITILSISWLWLLIGEASFSTILWEL